VKHPQFRVSGFGFRGSDVDLARQDYIIYTPSGVSGVGFRDGDLDGVPDVDGLVDGDLVESDIDHPDQVVSRHVVLQGGGSVHGHCHFVNSPQVSLR